MFEKMVVRILRLVAFVMFAAMIAVVFIQVMLRYFTDYSLAWSDEISRFLLIWVSFIGVVIIHYSDAGHPGMTFLADKLPERARAVIDFVLNAVLIVGFVALTIYGIQFTVSNHSFVSLVLGWPNSYKYVIFPISMALMCIKSVLRLVNDVKKLVKKEKEL